MSTPDISAAQAAAMDAEDRRRQLAGQSPGLGSLTHLPQPPAGPGVGLSDVDLPVIGEGYDTAGEIAAVMHKSYGPPGPQYADPLVGGFGFQGGRSEPAIRHVTNPGDGRLFIEGASGPAPDRFVVVSPPAKPGLLARLAARLRRR